MRWRGSSVMPTYHLCRRRGDLPVTFLSAPRGRLFRPCPSEKLNEPVSV
jgi:hypothetical protein